MSKNIRTQLNKIVGQSMNAYHQKLKPTIDEIKFKEQYQGRIIDCMVGEIDDNYIETPETDSPIVKLEYSKEGIVKIPSIKGKTILVDADGNETDTPGEGCKLVSVGDDGKLVVTTKNKNLFDGYGNFIDISGVTNLKISSANTSGCERILFALYDCDGTLINDSGIQTSSNFYHRSSDGLWMLSANAQTLNHTITLNGDFKYIRFTNMNGNHSYSLYNDIQLEVGVVISPYVPHQSHTAEILLDEPLRSLPNGVCDECIDNKIIRRVGKMNLKDLDKLQYANTIVWGSGNTHGAYQWMSVASVNGGGANRINYKYSNNAAKPNVISHIYPYHSAFHGGNSNGSPDGLPSVFFAISNDGHARLMVSKTLINPENPSSVKDSEFKSWVVDNLDLGIDFIYELAEPTIEELPNAIALQGFDDTTVYVESNLNPVVKYGYNAVIPFKQEIQTQKEEVEFNTSDIEENIIPYLMDVEFNLMMMEE